MTQANAPSTFDHQGTTIAYRRVEGASPGLLWLGGFRSDMEGTKAERLSQWCESEGLAFTRFDYSGHGSSGGRFADGTISIWLSEALAVLDRLTAAPTILVGSSMGAWIALRMAQEIDKRGEAGRLAGMLLLAPAPDFTERLMAPDLTEAQKADLETKGYFEEPTPYGPDPNVYTKALFDDGRANQVLTGPIDTHCPVHIIQGMADPDVPYRHAQLLMQFLPADDATLTFVKDGDHRLSRDEDIALILRAANGLVEGARAD